MDPMGYLTPYFLQRPNHPTALRRCLIATAAASQGLGVTKKRVTEKRWIHRMIFCGTQWEFGLMLFLHNPISLYFDEFCFFCLGDECLVFQTGMPTHYPMWGYVWPMNLQISEVSMQPWNIYGTQECIYTGYTVDIVSLWSVFQKVRMDYLHTSSKPTRQELRPVCFPCGKSNVLDILIPFLYQGRKTGSTIFRGGLGYAYDYIYSTYIYIYIILIYNYIYTACRAYISIKYPTCAKSISMIIIIHLTIWVCHPKVVSSLWFWALLVLDKRR